ncbi:MAG: transposase, partial [Smithella sp.]
YIELNPVRAGITKDSSLYKWSSAKSHIIRKDNELVKVKPLLDLVPDWRNFLKEGIEEKEIVRIRQHERTGRPLGDEKFIRKIEKAVDRVLRKKKPGPKQKKL